VQLPCCESVLDLVIRYLAGRAPEACTCADAAPGAPVAPAPAAPDEAGADAALADEAGAGTMGDTILIGCSGE
jgi:hypothetical protein